MKKVFCDICDRLLETDTCKESHFTVKITSPFCDMKNLKAHVCTDCYDKLMIFLNRAESEDNA